MTTSNQRIVERYMAACTNADRDELLEILAVDAVHYFSPREMKPVQGAEQIAELWLNAQAVRPKWTVDNAVAQGDQVVIEFTNVFFSDPNVPSTQKLNRGCEWYRIQAGKIVEIRAYFDSDYSRDAGLTGYPYEAMGYTMKEADA